MNFPFIATQYPLCRCSITILTSHRKLVRGASLQHGTVRACRLSLFEQRSNSDTRRHLLSLMHTYRHIHRQYSSPRVMCIIISIRRPRMRRLAHLSKPRGSSFLWTCRSPSLCGITSAFVDHVQCHGASSDGSCLLLRPLRLRLQLGRRFGPRHRRLLRFGLRVCLF